VGADVAAAAARGWEWEWEWEWDGNGWVGGETARGVDGNKIIIVRVIVRGGV